MEAYNIFVAFILVSTVIGFALGLYNIFWPSETTINVINEHNKFDENEKE